MSLLLMMTAMILIHPNWPEDAVEESRTRLLQACLHRLIGASSKSLRSTAALQMQTAYPSAWMTYRAAVRTACNTRQTEIDNCSDVAALKELMTGSAQIQQTDDNGPVFDADGNAVMIANPNIATAWPDPVE